MDTAWQRKNAITNSLQIEGLLEQPEVDTLMALLSQVYHMGMKVAEVGCYMGGTTVAIAKSIVFHNGQVFAVDIWEDEDIYKKFLNGAGLIPTIFPIKMDSHLAPDLFVDNYFDLVFLDADHRYSAVIKDIELWTPKVKKGGILCGHDCEKKYTEWDKEDQDFIDDNIEIDKTPFPCHAGVVRALYDTFNDNYEHGDNRVWWKVK